MAEPQCGQTSYFIFLTPSLPQPVKFPGLKMDGRNFANSIFSGPIAFTFSAVRFDENPFTRQ